MWIKAQNGRLFNSDHIEMACIEANWPKEGDFTIFAKTPSGGFGLATFATREEAQRQLRLLYDAIAHYEGHFPFAQKDGQE